MRDVSKDKKGNMPTMKTKVIVNNDIDVSSMREKDDSNAEEDEVEDLCDIFKKKIEDLMFYKVFQPLSTSNKSILSNMESIISIMEKIDVDSICIDVFTIIYSFSLLENYSSF
jgi:hypothetical protein